MSAQPEEAPPPPAPAAAAHVLAQLRPPGGDVGAGLRAGLEQGS